MNAKPKTELNSFVFVQKLKSVNGALVLRNPIQTILNCLSSRALAVCFFLSVSYLKKTRRLQVWA